VYRALSDSSKTSWDIIEDFTKGEDRIDLRGLGFTGIGTTAASGSKLSYAYNATTNETTILAASNFKIVLNGEISLGASDFLLG
jgi:hypothetical protein